MQIIMIMMKVLGEYSNITAYEQSNVYNISHNSNTFFAFHIFKLMVVCCLYK